jgi:hypothetical protein
MNPGELVPDVVRAIDMRVYRGKRADREFQQRRAPSEAPPRRSERSVAARTAGAGTNPAWGRSV